MAKKFGKIFREKLNVKGTANNKKIEHYKKWCKKLKQLINSSNYLVDDQKIIIINLIQEVEENVKIKSIENSKRIIIEFLGFCFYGKEEELNKLLDELNNKANTPNTLNPNERQ